jgi:hypothetical protein
VNDVFFLQSGEEKVFRDKEDSISSNQKKEALRLKMERDRIEREKRFFERKKKNSPRNCSRELTKILLFSHVTLDLELVEKAKEQLREKIHQEGKEFVEKREQAAEKKQKVQVFLRPNFHLIF